MNSSSHDWNRTSESSSHDNQNAERYIYIVSDGTGETAANIVRSLITQFSDVSGVFIRRYPNVKHEADVDKLLANAELSKGPVMVAYTLVNSALRDYLLSQILQRGIMGYDLFSTLIAQLSKFFGSQPGESPNLFHGVNERYFKRMEAIEFTLRHDDGKNVNDLSMADIILVGVSRTGKTPLSMYLSLYGHKVVNIPLAPGIPPPPALFEVPQSKIVALTIDPTRLVEIEKEESQAST